MATKAKKSLVPGTAKFWRSEDEQREQGKVKPERESDACGCCGGNGVDGEGNWRRKCEAEEGGLLWARLTGWGGSDGEGEGRRCWQQGERKQGKEKTVTAQLPNEEENDDCNGRGSRLQLERKRKNKNRQTLTIIVVTIIVDDWKPNRLAIFDS
ncbi:hypothetical protein OIU76_024760 [Salix suchowensis]|uniref:Uncharacterized protein n=2 Tax=Salix TaxID=40685 RepID=A0A9Q0UP74_9ROSI|nr:hypothetical protein OIU76_024760 [Salix suchowensis]KAJ6365950.1 hypothetical protein OIU77_002506 [Salix suchowensis]KAJ6733360.1 hypothetical protein OIU74_005168 [Salix koriyanagi]